MAHGDAGKTLTTEEEKAKAAQPKAEFTECDKGCPTMVVVPAGKFMMGSPDGEKDRDNDAGPRREVTIARPFAVSKDEMTFAEWDMCVAAGACPKAPDRWGRDSMPVINVSWHDSKEYAVNRHPTLTLYRRAKMTPSFDGIPTNVTGAAKRSAAA